VNRVLPSVDWVADNAVYAGHFPGNARYLAWLARRAEHAAACRFVTAPDVVGDAVATLARSAPVLPMLRAAGYPAALVAQDGLEHLRVPWDDFDCLFIGGTTSWKLGAAAAVLVADAKAAGKWVHCGRVNSRRRFLAMAAIGCDSADGTCVAYAPDVYLPQVIAWQREASATQTLF
jgi:hypothetical protein